MTLQGALIVLFASVCINGGFLAAEDPQAYVIHVVAPKKCEGNACKLNLTITNVKEGLWFSLEAEDKAYVAVALGESGLMGNDSVIECVRDEKTNKITLHHSKNRGIPFMKRGNTRVNITDPRVVMNITSSWEDGRIHCAFITKVGNSTGSNSLFDTSKLRYYLQIVSGEKLKENGMGIGYHSQWATTLGPISLVQDEGRFTVASNVVPACSGASDLSFTSGAFILTIFVVVKCWFC